jgi:hypothetical protein
MTLCNRLICITTRVGQLQRHVETRLLNYNLGYTRHLLKFGYEIQL